MAKRLCSFVLAFLLIVSCCFLPNDLLAQGRNRGGGRGGFGGFGGQPSGPKQKPEELKFRDGVATIKDRATFEKLSYKGPEVLIDTHLADIEFVKFQLEDANTKDPQLYFINTNTHRAHMMFMSAVGIPRSGFGGFFGGGEVKTMRGVLAFRPLLKNPSGGVGLYTYEFEPNDRFKFEAIQIAHNMLLKKMPMLKGKVGFHPMPFAQALYKQEKEKYDKAKIPVYLDDDLFSSDVGFLPLNHGESYGRLRIMELGDRPTQRDIVIYKTLPNEMPRVAGILTAARQTPLSHVNLRAIQDKVPNAFVIDAAEDKTIQSLVGSYVYYKVTENGYEIRKASSSDVEKHFLKLRPKETQTPVRDLASKAVRSLDDLGFEDSKSVGVKAANMAAMRKFGFPEDVVPAGHAVPFYFYDEFMKHNGFYDVVKAMTADSEFQKNPELQKTKLKELRKLIKKGTMPEWMMTQLDELHKSFPEGTSVRCRSSTNNEDLPGFSGAGLYDSCTHRPDEGHFSKSIKQVFASLWNFRAFEEREFYRVDHMQAAMGVLCHPNFSDERANGVAVTSDILYQTQGNYYVNTQVGEDLVTNPEDESIPEEVLLDWWRTDRNRIMRESNRLEPGNRVLEMKHLDSLRRYLARIHSKFATLYGKKDDDSFSMEIEFKVTKDDVLSIKQARPWVN